MDRNIILVAETGSDTPVSVAEELGIILVPMHVNMADQTLEAEEQAPWLFLAGQPSGSL